MCDLEILEYDLTICKLRGSVFADPARPGAENKPPADAPGLLSALTGPDGFFILQKTPDEVSLVCETKYAPPCAEAAEAGWKAFRVAGVLDFGLIGILAKITAVLAEAGIGVFAASTYNTDYILMKAEAFDCGLEALRRNGYNVMG